MTTTTTQNQEQNRMLSPESVESLRKSFGGEIVIPGDEGYERARKVWNGMIDKHPVIVARCSSPEDILKAVNFARNNKLIIAVRGGGHNVAGFATCDGGIVIDLSKMKKIEVNPVSRTAKAEPGLAWGEFDNATQAHGLAVTGGLVSTTGIAGFTLGGGIGWLVRKQGLTIDNLISVSIVTADGRAIRASSDENPDLFWGIRGGGGNFGIVSSFEYALQPVGPVVLGGILLFPFVKASEVLKGYRKFIENIPDELTTIAIFLTAPSAPFVPSDFQGKKALALAVCYSGSNLDEGKKIIEPLKHLTDKMVDLIQPLPYCALQSMFDESAPPGVQNYWKSAYLRNLDDKSIETLLAAFANVASPMSAVHLHYLGGAVRRTGEDATAFGNREAPFVMNLVSTWTNTSENEKNIDWTRKTFQDMQSFAYGVYVNFLGEEGRDRIVAAYGDSKYLRLSKLKAKYDPQNLFRLNQNIAPEK